MSQSALRTGTDPTTGVYATQSAIVPYYGHKEYRDDRDYTKHPEVISVKRVHRGLIDKYLPFGGYKEVEPKHKSFKISEADTGIVNDQLDRVNRKAKKRWERKTYGYLSSYESRYKGLSTIEADKKDASERPLDYLTQEEEDRVIGMLEEARKPLWHAQAQKHISEKRTGLRKMRLDVEFGMPTLYDFSNNREIYHDVMSFISAYGFDKDQLIREGEKVKTLMQSYYWQVGDTNEILKNPPSITYSYCPTLDQQCNLTHKSKDQAAASILHEYNQKVETALKDLKKFSNIYEAMSFAGDGYISWSGGTFASRKQALRYLHETQNELEQSLQDAVRVHNCQEPCALSRTWEGMLEGHEQRSSSHDQRETNQLALSSASNDSTHDPMNETNANPNRQVIKWKFQTEEWHNMKKYFSTYGTIMTELCASVEPSYNMMPSRYDEAVQSISQVPSSAE